MHKKGNRNGQGASKKDRAHPSASRRRAAFPGVLWRGPDGRFVLALFGVEPLESLLDLQLAHAPVDRVGHRTDESRRGCVSSVWLALKIRIIAVDPQCFFVIRAFGWPSQFAFWQGSVVFM